MDEKKLAKIQREIDSARARVGNLRHRDLAKIAKMLGRVRSKDRTNEPTYVSNLLLDANVITIPDHSRGVNKFTAKNILNQLEEDALKLEEKLRIETERGIIYAKNDFEN